MGLLVINGSEVKVVRCEGCGWIRSVGLGVWFRVISGVWSSIRSVTRGVCGQGKWSQGGGGSCMV